MYDELTHFHMHVVPRYSTQNFAEFYSENESDEIQDVALLHKTKRKIQEALNLNLQ